MCKILGKFLGDKHSVGPQQTVEMKAVATEHPDRVLQGTHEISANLRSIKHIRNSKFERRGYNSSDFNDQDRYTKMPQNF